MAEDSASRGRAAPPTAGYSGRTMAQKLGVKAGDVIALLHAPADWQIPDLPPQVETRADLDGAFTIAIWFVRGVAELTTEAEWIASREPRGASLWVAWPRRAGGHVSDVTEQALRDFLLPTGLVDVKVAALDNDWSGLKFLWRRAKRPAAPY
jgi:hypothetical protein